MAAKKRKKSRKSKRHHPTMKAKKAYYKNVRKAFVATGKALKKHDHSAFASSLKTLGA